MKSASRSATAWAICVVLASTITRIRASVPEGRTSTRPAPARASLLPLHGLRQRGDAIMASFTPPLWGTSTFTSTWG